MNFTKKSWLEAILLTIGLVAFISCGGGGATTPANFTSDNGAQPGVQGNLDPSAPGNQTDLLAPVGSSGGAPVGSGGSSGGSAAAGEVEDFNPLNAEELEFETLKDGLQYDFLWSAITNDGDEPDPQVMPDDVHAGTKVNLWVQYYAAAGASLKFHWQMLETGLNYIGEPIDHRATGKYLTKFDYYVPFGSNTDTVTLTVDIVDAKEASVWVVTDPPPPDSEPNPLEWPEGLLGGHFDLDTSSYISQWYVGPRDKGSTDGHVHEYDDLYSVVGMNAFNIPDQNLHDISTDVPAKAKFKLIIANADLSPGGRLVINDDYYRGVPETWTDVMDYDNTSLADLPIYSFDGADGTVQLSELGIYFEISTIMRYRLHPTQTKNVKENFVGRHGEWRNGALTIQAVEVNADGTDNFTTNQSYSNGGVQGVATSGLLWEATIFWHWEGPAYHETGWYTWSPTGIAGINAVLGIISPEEVSPTDYPTAWEEDHAQMVWEDPVATTDYDYNDMVISMHTQELRDTGNSLAQLNLNIKALARGVDYGQAWQFNLGASMPGSGAYAVINQYYADGTPHGAQRIWESNDGLSLPIFLSSNDALPPPVGEMATNAFNDQQFVDGDYADISIVFDPAVPAGTYTSAPYFPEIVVTPSTGDQEYTLGLWNSPGDPVDGNGRPYGFIVPDTYAWPVEGETIWDVYSGFNGWVEWINDQTLLEPSPAWWEGTPADGLFYNLHLQ